MPQRVIMLVLLALAILLCAVQGESYGEHEPVSVLVNTVGPFNNPAEAYKFYSLPYCAPTHEKGKNTDEKLGEMLAGDRRRASLYDIRFKVGVQWQSICRVTVNQDAMKQWMDAIDNRYVFEMFVDDLSVKGFVGEKEITSLRFAFDEHVHNETHTYLFTHMNFEIDYNGDNVIGVSLTTDPLQRVELRYGEDLDVEFSYSVHWSHTSVKYVDRYQYHQRSAIMEQSEEIHWLSIINSLVLVALLTAFLTIILMRALRKDFAKYMEIDDVEVGEDLEEEMGWKALHGDVFRFPQHSMLFASLIGCGAQMLSVVVFILLLSLVGIFYPGNRGAIYSAAVMLYALTAGVGGYVSTNTYIEMGGKHWAGNAVLTACVFTVPALLVFSVVNTTAVFYGSASALPFGTIMIIVLLWALVTFPLTIIGAMRAKKANNKFDAPCKTKMAARQIPPIPWYRHAVFHLLIAGFLPFSAIFIELHYIFNSVWGHQVYTYFGILSLAFLLLIIVASFITVSLTYFQLVAQDYHWWWRAFLSGSSTGFFMFCYSCFYYVYRSDMSGPLQASFFFGYMFLVSYGFALLLGFVSYFCSLKFVKHIYLSIKVD